MSRNQWATHYQLDPHFGHGFVREDDDDQGDGDGDGGRRDAGTGDDRDKPHAPDDVDKLRKEVAALRKRERETADRAKKAQQKLEATMAEVGDGKEVEAFREWKKNREKEEQERQRREGEFDALEKNLRAKNQELENTLAQEREAREREDVARALLSSSLKLRALDADQIERIYGPDFHKKDGKVVHRTEYNDDGDPMTPEEFLAREKDGKASNLFETNRRGGSGAGGGESADTGAAVLIRMVNGQIPADQQAIYEKAKKEGRRIEFRHERAA